ncbi:MAG: hypothetical protein KA885_03445 [Spirochaetes bacterium]|nr:hypothetical protein [Spirochaetota bacterium]
MSIQEEVKDLLGMILNHPDEIYRLKLSVKLKNGTYFNYRIDKKKEERAQLDSTRRKHALEEKYKKLEEKKKKREEKSGEKPL